MKYRPLGKTDLTVSVVGVGTWQFGGEWGKTFTQDEVDAILSRLPGASQHPAVTAVIPGCRSVMQEESNARAAELDLVRDDHPQAVPA